MNKRLAAILLSAAVTAGTLTLCQANASAAGTVWKQNANSIAARGWVIQNSKWYFYNNGQKSTGWLLSNGKWYFLNTGGDMKTGWLLYKNKWYYMNSSGDMASNSWVCYNNKWYYLNSSGEMAVSTITSDGYKVGADGAWIAAVAYAPKNVSATAVYTSSIKVTWDAVEDADYYYVYYMKNGDSNYTKVKCTTNSYTMSGLDPNTKVYFKVTSVVDDEESASGNTVYALTEKEPVSAPESVDAEALSSSSIKVTWDEVEDADCYYVYYKASGDDDYTKVKKTTNSCTISNLDQDTKYYFKVSAVADGDESGYSDTAYAVTDEEISAPEDLDAEATSSSSIDLTWDEVDDADYYIVYYKESGASTYDSEKVDDNSITLDDLDADTKYYFKVKAVVDGDKSDYSDTVYATTDSD